MASRAQGMPSTAAGRARPGERRVPVLQAVAALWASLQSSPLTAGALLHLAAAGPSLGSVLGAAPAPLQVRCLCGRHRGIRGGILHPAQQLPLATPDAASWSRRGAGPAPHSQLCMGGAAPAVVRQPGPPTRHLCADASCSPAPQQDSRPEVSQLARASAACLQRPAALTRVWGAQLQQQVGALALQVHLAPLRSAARSPPLGHP